MWNRANKEADAMFELIPSKQVRDYMDEIGFEFTDHQKATLIWNAVGYNHYQILDALKELAETTGDLVTKKQIEERISYEETKLERIRNNQDNKHVYVVTNDDGLSYGYFNRYDTALAYAKKLHESLEIEKQRIIEGNKIPRVKRDIGLNPRYPDTKVDTYYEYCGIGDGGVLFNEAGEIIGLRTNEMSDEEESLVNEFDSNRFEFPFINIPFPPNFMKGIPVKHISSGRYGIIQEGSEIWDEFINRIRKGLYVDYYDMSIKVQFLDIDGCWAHDHINPIYLEVGMPDFKEEPELYRAMDALSEYWSGKENAEHEELVIKYSREYGIKHQKKLDADTATKLEDIMF